MLTRQPRQLITHENIAIYERNYQVPVIKNKAVKIVQKKIQERQKVIKEGVRYEYKFAGIIKRKKAINQGEILNEIQLFINDYIYVIEFLEKYKSNYHNFLLNLTVDLKEIFQQKYLEIKHLEDERSRLELKNHQHPQILDELTREKQENLKAALILSNAYFLILEKISLISEGIIKLAEDTQKQKDLVEKIIKDLKVYQEIYEYQSKARKVRQEIAKIAHGAVNFEDSLQAYFNPFQSLIDEVVKVDEYFYTTVEDIKNLGDQILNYQSNLFNFEADGAISDTFLDFMVTGYEKKARLKDALIKSQLLNLQIDNFDLNENGFLLEQGIDIISNYLCQQFTEQRKLLGTAAVNCISTESLAATEKTGLMGLANNNFTFTKEFLVNQDIDYSQLQNLLAQNQWKRADIETSKLMLTVLKKNYWHEVYQADIDNFPCHDIHIIDQLWEHYSYGYFGFSIQQTIWSEMGGQVDYETEKRLGDRLGWRKQGNWLNYEQLTFELSPMTPMGHLPAKWLHYDQNIVELSAKSTAHLSMAAWRVKSWLIWQMHLFFSRVKTCQATGLCVNCTSINNRKK
ncbi:GUN4 domain-containing protein [Halotia branconii]|uniref:GUN4 domain-containing protein n=1 Tax=Halotia branconii CENA392 TaxID=1539056 RepID=A0AAJ6NR02_9CYAN|nr:GUN4 domain-containing protein [Halotia branconii]WGV25105.1 GUN4 domain-containing protein [Halotia branconii CENA392]